jgi:hypothetical protein
MALQYAREDFHIGKISREQIVEQAEMYLALLSNEEPT